MDRERMTDAEIQAAVDSIFAMFDELNPLVGDARKIVEQARDQMWAKIIKDLEKSRVSKLDTGGEG